MGIERSRDDLHKNLAFFTAITTAATIRGRAKMEATIATAIPTSKCSAMANVVVIGVVAFG